MAEANQAFEHGDANRLAKILEESSLRPEPPEGTTTDTDLLRAIRKITLRARLHVTFLERFESERMKSGRTLLAEQLLTAGPFNQVAIVEFFDEMHTFLHDSYLDEDLLWSSFGFSATRWWNVCKNYIYEERTRRNDPTLFGGFQDLSVRFTKRNELAGFKEPGTAELTAFLESERKRTVREGL